MRPIAFADLFAYPAVRKSRLHSFCIVSSSSIPIRCNAPLSSFSSFMEYIKCHRRYRGCFSAWVLSILLRTSPVFGSTYSSNFSSNFVRASICSVGKLHKALRISVFVVLPFKPLPIALPAHHPSFLPICNMLYKLVSFITSLLSRKSAIAFLCSGEMYNSSFFLLRIVMLLAVSRILESWDKGDVLGHTLGPIVISFPFLVIVYDSNSQNETRFLHDFKSR